jgi:hypothetical protein
VASDDVGWTPLQRRLRRLALLSSAFAVADAAFGMLPNGLEVTHSSVNPPGQVLAHGSTGGWTLAMWALVQVWLACRLWLRPGQRQGMRWVAQALAVDFFGGFLWFIENVTFDHWTARWPADITAGWVGSATVLVFAAIPVVLFADDDPTPEVPPARIVAL